MRRDPSPSLRSDKRSVAHDEPFFRARKKALSPRALVAGVLVTTTLVVSTTAGAQEEVSTAFASSSVVRYDAAGDLLTRKYSPPFENAIATDDCAEDLSVALQLVSTGECADCVLESWAGPEGEDCTDINVRTGSTARCWQVAPSRPFEAGVTEEKIRVQDLLSGFGAGASADPYEPSTSSACGASTGANARVSVAKLVLRAQRLVAFAGTSLPLHMTRPTAAILTSARAGGAWFELEVEVPSNAPAVRSHVAYCIPVAETDVEAVCGPERGGASRPLAAPADPTPYECGRFAGAQGGTMLVAAPAPGVPFVVAVAAFDELGLVGPATAWDCPLETPSPLKGSCAVAPRDRVVESKGWLWGAALVALLALVRRRRGR